MRKITSWVSKWLDDRSSRPNDLAADLTFGPSRSAGDTDLEDFEEAAYLERYSDVARAVARGQFPSGRTHFDLYGRAEGRKGSVLNLPERVDLEPGSCIRRICSPALVTRPPVIVNEESIPEELRSRLQAIWNEQRPAVEITCHCLHDVIVVGDGLVFDSRGRLVTASAHQTSAVQIDQAAAKVRDFLASGGSPTASGTTLLCEKIGAFNYGHWLVEMAPIAFILRDKLVSDWYLRAPLIEGLPTMSAVIRDSLELLSIKSARVRWATGAAPQHYERVILTRGFSHHGASYSPLASAALSDMAARVPAEPRSRIWVSRADTRRRMQDESGLCEALAARGWTIVTPGTLSLRSQIALFKDADVVAGVSGAGLTNFAFSPTTTKVIAFTPARMPDVFFWMLAQMKDQAYTEIRCAQEYIDDSLFNWDGMLMMETGEALGHLDQIVTDR